MTSTDRHLKDIKTILAGIGITQVGIAFGIAAVVFNSGLAVPIAILATAVGFVWIASGYKDGDE